MILNCGREVILDGLIHLGATAEDVRMGEFRERKKAKRESWSRPYFQGMEKEELRVEEKSC